MKRIYKTCLLVGRFQPFHIGHFKMIQKALQLAETVLVFVGSAQESKTKRNPFSYEERRLMISNSFNTNRLIIKPFFDIKAGDNSIWGEYVLESAKKELGNYPELYLSGSEIIRNSWFAGLSQANGLDEISIHKTDDISASILREKMLSCSEIDIEVKSKKYLECLEKIPQKSQFLLSSLIRTLKIVQKN